MLLIDIIIIFVAVIGVYLYARLKKSGELAEININFKSILRQQKMQTEQSESINQVLQKESIYYQIQISAYKEKSIQAIDTVYQCLIDVQQSARELGHFANEQKYTAFVKSVDTFRDRFERQKIWLPQPLAQRIETLAVEIDSRCHKYILASKRLEVPQYRNADEVNKLCDIQDAFYDYIHQESRDIFQDLVRGIADEFGPEPNKQGQATQ